MKSSEVLSKMPTGLILMEWDDRVGANVIMKYPQDTELSKKTLMQIYGTHEYNQEVGIISLTIGQNSITSYYSGPEYNIYIILVLLMEDTPDAYDESLTDISNVIIQNKENSEKLKKLMPQLFHRVAVYPTFDEKRKLMFIYSDELKRILLERLRVEGSLFKSEISVWFKEEYETLFVDIENVIDRFIKIGLIKQASVKGISGDVLFMNHDLILYRVPPAEILKNPSSRGLPSKLSKFYTAGVREYFRGYIPNKEDNLALMNLMLEPDVYETVKLLRTAIVTLDDFEKLKKKGVYDINSVLKKLEENDFLIILQKDGTNYYGLKSDYNVERFFPQFLVNGIRKDSNNNVKNKKVLLEHLKILKETYQAETKKKKKKK